MSETQHFEKENIQTASDADDDMEDTDTESQTMTQFDTPQYTMTMVSTETSLMNVKESLNNVAGQPSTWATQSDKRGTSQMDLDQPPTRTALLEKREKQEELINNMKTEVEKQQGEHVHNINEMKKQWETTLREQEEQLAKAQKEIERTHVQQQQQLEEYIKQTHETLSKANCNTIEATIQKIQEDAHNHLAQEQMQQEADLCEKLAQHEEELKRKTNEEVR
ncbi:hypothetical protein BDR04DRAFT_1149955 [Suillus decipiens]|nr:hypothetical protein BDR04DRAFT_1149955 [Suillus decipiens]